MNKANTILLIFFSYTLLSLNTHAQNCQWAYTASYSTYDHISSLKQDLTGNVYLSSYKDSVGNLLGTRIEKRNSANAILWNFIFTGDAAISDLEIKSSNHAVFTGYFKGNLNIGSTALQSPLFYSAFIAEADENGTITWAVSFNPALNDFKPVDLFIDANQDLYMTAAISGTHGFCSFHKLDTWGNPLLNEFNDNFEDRTFSHIIADGAGNVYISGTCGNGATFDTLSVPNIASYQNMLVKYNDSFHAQWVISRPYITFDDNNGLGSDNHSLYWSFVESYLNADTIRLVKADFNGQIQLDVPGPLSDAFFPSVSMETDPNGNSVLISNIYTRLFCYRFDNHFNQTWNDTFYTNTSGMPPDLKIACYDSSFFIGSRFLDDSLYIDSILLLNPNYPGFNGEVFFSKWALNTSVNVDETSSHSTINIFPNPAEDVLNIEYKESIPVLISLIDYSGKIVIQKQIFNGNNFIELRNLSNGLYLLNMVNLTITSNGKNGTRIYQKIIVQH